GYRLTSPADIAYNCVAWGAGESHRWWEPAAGYYWPPDVPVEATVNAYEAALASLGYVPTASVALEPGIEKVVLYADASGLPTHVARQLPTGRWTSKLGQSVDIEHRNPAALISNDYGRPVLTLARATGLPPAQVGGGGQDG
ncbi:MAG TPA: hypothetical protein VMM12_05430, partial [Longimicrobiales bacterium]|nr:hypothetical protein [Longimicrobiales bacterium]